MKKSALLLLLLVCYCCSTAQNYHCLRSDSTFWYTNSNNYLRGIRVDSVKASGTDTIYYLFRTYRFYPSSDTAGGSWVGKDVVKKIDGTYLFGNEYQDTVVIKTQATLGSSWIFYNDSGSKYYTATVTKVDTMTVLGSIDSIKEITINAFNLDIPLILTTRFRRNVTSDSASN